MQPISSWPLCTLVFTQLTNLYMILTRHASIVFVVCNLLDRKRQLAKKSKSNIAKLAGEACPLLVPALSSLHRDPKRAKQLRHTHGTTVRRSPSRSRPPPISAALADTFLLAARKSSRFTISRPPAARLLPLLVSRLASSPLANLAARAGERTAQRPQAPSSVESTTRTQLAGALTQRGRLFH